MQGGAAMEIYELAIFFETKGVRERNYLAGAWDVFMRNCSPEIIKEASLFHGDVPGHAQMFCIAVRSESVHIINYLKDVFASCDDKRLAAPRHRLRENGAIHEFGLKPFGRIDSKGRLETKEWNRIVHTLCRATGWPYIPQKYPSYLQPALISELEEMAEPGVRHPSGPVPGSEYLATSDTKRTRTFKAWPAMSPMMKYAVILSVLALLGILWFNHERLFGTYLQERWEKKVTRLLGADGFAAYKKGFCLVNIAQLPPELPLDKMNRQLTKKSYFVLQCSDKSFINASLECVLAFSGGRTPGERIQAEAAFTMETLDGTLLWTSRTRGVSPPKSAIEEEKRRTAVLAAVNRINLSGLPDGRALKEKGFAIARMENDQNELRKERRRKQQRKEKNLQTSIERHVLKQWIMRHRLFMKTGKTLDVIVLHQTPRALSVITDTGRRMVPRTSVEKIEPFDTQMYSECISKAMFSMSESLVRDWERKVCDRCINEMSAKFIQYGPAYPDAHIICLESHDETGALVAKAKTEEGELALAVGDKISGFEVIGIDAQTRTVLLRWGKEGDILRIWPEPAPH